MKNHKNLKFGSQIAIELRIPRYGLILKITIFGHETWNLIKVPEVAYGPSFYPRGSKLSLFSLYGQRFPRYGPILKIPYLGIKPGIEKSARSCIWTLFLPRGVEIELIFALQAAVSQSQQF